VKLFKRKKQNRRKPDPAQARLQLRQAVLATSLVLVLATLGYGVHWLLQPTTLPLHQVVVSGRLHKISEIDVVAAVRPFLHSGFFKTDMASIRNAVTALPWVAHASARRVWPDTVAIQVSEQAPLARWDDTALVNVDGELFYPGKDSFPKDLPVFHAPAGDHALITSRYLEMNNLLYPLNVKITSISMNARRALRIQLDNNIELLLGRTADNKTMQRFVTTWSALLAAKAQSVERVDMRYGNGFAVRWREAAIDQKEG
jgi:cell division protein FtsQ